MPLQGHGEAVPQPVVRPAGPYRGRFAPSPSGDLHFGSLVAALGSWLRARSLGGTWLVRIEDLDPPREVAGASARILDALAAFGLVSDEPVWRQGSRADAYAVALDRLREAGHAYPCRCSRRDLGEGGLHGPACRLPHGPRRSAVAWRVHVPDARIEFEDAIRGPYGQHLAREIGDFVVRRVEGWAAYQLAVVVDDAAQGITEVVRGADLLDSTPRQILLQRYLQLPTPRYAHLPVALDDRGAKLSKQARSAPVRADHPLPALRQALRFLGLARSATSPAATVERLLALAVAEFDLAQIPRTDAPVPTA